MKNSRNKRSREVQCNSSKPCKKAKCLPSAHVNALLIALQNATKKKH